MFICFDMIHERDRHTHRHTNTDGIASLGKNPPQVFMALHTYLVYSDLDSLYHITPSSKAAKCKSMQ